LLAPVRPILQEAGVSVTDEAYLLKVIDRVKERCVLLTDFPQQSSFFFQAPATIDLAAIQPKWTTEKAAFFRSYSTALHTRDSWTATELEACFKEAAAAANLKPGELQLPLRIMLVGGKFGPPVFEIAEVLGRDETLRRIEHTLHLL
jgi:glutamyl-tRNA synthetase